MLTDTTVVVGLNDLTRNTLLLNGGPCEIKIQFFAHVTKRKLESMADRRQYKSLIQFVMVLILHKVFNRSKQMLSTARTNLKGHERMKPTKNLQWHRTLGVLLRRAR